MDAASTASLSFAGFSPVSSSQWEEAARESLKGRPLEALDVLTEDGLRLPPRHAPCAELPFQAEDPDLPPRAAGLSRQWPWGKTPREVSAQLAWLAARGQRELPLWVDPAEPEDLAAWTIALKAQELSPGTLLVHGRRVKALFRWLQERSAGEGLRVDVFGPALREGRKPEPSWAIELAEVWRSAEAQQVKWRVSGWPLHQAGATGAQELGLWLALWVEGLRRLEAAGAPLEMAMRQAEHEISCTPSLFESMARLRAARLLGARLGEALGMAPEQRALWLCARGSTHSHSRTEAWTNSLRVALSGFAAMAGGADAIHLPTVADGLGEADEHLARLAANTLELLREEALLDRVEDPARGSGHVEALTLGLAEKAWSFFQEIEEAGGVWSALACGRPQVKVAHALEQRRERVLRRRQVLVGSSRFARAHEEGVSWLGAPSSMESSSWVDFPPLHTRRLSEELETLRRRGEATGSVVHLLALGNLKEQGPRVDFCRDLFATAGLGVQVVQLPMGNEDAEAVGVAGQGRVLVLCGQDEAYAQMAEAVVRGLRAEETRLSSPRRLILLAGQGGALAETLLAAGLDGFVHARGRLDDMLRPILDQLEVQP